LAWLLAWLLTDLLLVEGVVTSWLALRLACLAVLLVVQYSRREDLMCVVVA